jgi:WhiB family transcriptional regulator, redox-sensing transcriptional regulator
MQWRAEAACRDVDPELFFTDAENGPALRRMRPIAEMNCRQCPALERCAEYADDQREQGLWAGTFRTKRPGEYTRIPLFPGAPQFKLGPKVIEATVGLWVA